MDNMRSELGRLRLVDLLNEGEQARRATARRRHPRRPAGRGEPTAER